MLIPDTEEIIYTAKNELNKTTFYIQAFIISLIPALFLSGCYIFLQALNVFAYFAFVLVMYIVSAIYTASKTYKDYSRYFGNDEFAISKTRIYYNICMNIKGDYQNFDTNRLISDIREIIIKKGWNPKALVIYFNDDSHITIHSLKDVEEIKKMLEK